MVNETLSTVDTKKVQGILNSLSRREKKHLLRLLKLQTILGGLNEEEKRELFGLLNKGNDDNGGFFGDLDYNIGRIITSD